MAAGAGGNHDVFPFFSRTLGGSSSVPAGTAAAIAAVGRVLGDPLEVAAEPRVNSRVARPSAALAPRHDSCSGNTNDTVTQIGSIISGPINEFQ